MHFDNLMEPLVIVPLDRRSRISEKALRFAMKLSDHVQAVPVDAEEQCEQVCESWRLNVQAPLEHAGLGVPEFILVSSPYRFVHAPGPAHS